MSDSVTARRLWPCFDELTCMTASPCAPDAERIHTELSELATLVDSEAGGWTRLAMTEPDRAARHWVKDRMLALGMEVHIDPAGNVIGVLPGIVGGRSIMTGSHTDTVPSGGRFDGIVGVVGALEAVRCLQEAGIRLRHDVVVVDFFNEEPNRFGLSCVGSRAMTGSFDSAVLEIQDEEGMSFAQALEAAGFDVAAMARSGGGGSQPGHGPGMSSSPWTQGRWSWDTVDAFIELHIEQGPHLEDLAAQIGVVSQITGISRFRALFSGQRDHAGTTGMDARADAGCAAAGTVLAVERIARGGLQEAKGTTGGVSFTPAAVNVITEAADMRGEFRSPDGGWLREAEEALAADAAREAAARGVTVELEWFPTQQPQLMDPSVAGVCRDVVDGLGFSRAELFSGAEHDAAIISHRVPTAMLFVPSHQGRSHCPEEWTDLADVVAGVEALTHSLAHVDRRGG